MTRNPQNLMLAATIALAAALGCGQPAGSPDRTSREPAAANEPKITVSAMDLTKEYDANEIAADEKYRGKMLVVRGKISSIAETLGRMQLQLEGHGIMSVMCSLEDAERQKVSTVKKGQTVTVVGRGDGRTLGLYAGLTECRLE